MKNRAVLLIFVCLGLAINAYGQRKIITAGKFYSGTKNALEKSRVFPRRHLVTEENYVDGELVKTVNFIWEAVSDEKQRKVLTEKAGDRITKFETIEIGDNVYKRENDGPWRREDWIFEHGLTREVVEILGCSENSVENAVFNQQDVQIYESFQIGAAGGALTYEQERDWIDKNGKPLKEETTYGLLNPRSIIWHKELIYEYDANIKIEAPILSKETRP